MIRLFRDLFSSVRPLVSDDAEYFLKNLDEKSRSRISEVKDGGVVTVEVGGKRYKLQKAKDFEQSLMAQD